MQIVIDIDEKDFEIIKHNVAVDNPLCPLSQKEMVAAVANGIPLPKSHGRLIDEAELYEKYRWYFMTEVAEGILKGIPTVVETYEE